MASDVAPPRARLFQFSLLQLGLAATFVAVGSYSLTNASELWLRAWLTFYSLAMATGGLLFAYRQYETRAFFGGYLLFGGLYLSLIFSALVWSENQSIQSALISRLLPQAGLEFAYFRALPLVKEGPAPNAPTSMGYGSGNAGGGGGGGFFCVPDLLGQFGGAGGLGGMPASGSGGPASMAPAMSGWAYYPDYESFMGVGHCLVGLTLAYAGGLLGRVIYLTRPQVIAP